MTAAKPAKRSKPSKRHAALLEGIIDDATVDCYGEDEQFSGWLCTLQDSITCPQECTANNAACKLLKIIDAMGGRGVHALVDIGGKRLVVPAETLELRDKRQNAYILAYKEWL